MNRLRIHVLPEQIANRIAAGEIIERPASVVRELLDNSIDACAQRIEVQISNGGKSLIAVKDDGTGIDYDNLLLAFERHATSKINSLEDLDAIQTLGFRGEALPSIASVSKVTVDSYVRGLNSGSRINIEGGKIQNVQRIVCAPGTKFSITHLFYNVPARRKFLRTTKTEYGHIHECIIDHALSYPGIHFIFRDDDRKVLDVPPVDKWSSRLGSLMGENIVRNMLQIDEDVEGIRLSGFISTPDSLQSTARSQRLYVNGRRIRDRIVTQGVYRGYRQFLTSPKHPVYILKLDLPPEIVDVNVHPTKSEVRFQNPQMIFNLIVTAIQSVLSDSLKKSYTMSDPVNVLSSNTQNSQFIHDPWTPNRFKADESQRGNSFESQNGVNVPLEFQPQKTLTIEDIPEIPWRVVGQAFKTFILVEMNHELMIIDQHTAHERILFEQFRKQYVQQKIPSQSLLFPVSIDLDPTQANAVMEFLPMFPAMGIEIEPFGGNTFLIRTLPDHLKQERPEILLKNIADELAEVGHSDQNRAAERHMLITLACHRAIRAGDSLENDQMVALVNDLMRLQLPATCPHGRPIIIKFSKSEMEIRFKR